MYNRQPTYPVYRGLQKPLVFKSFRGKYIYWGLGSILTSLLASMIIFSTVNLLSGLLAASLISGFGLGYTAYHQKRGPKPRQQDIMIIPNQPFYHEA